MNKTLLVSAHALVAGLLVLALLLLSWATHSPLGRAPTGHASFLITSGWVALALFLVAYGYVLRKWAHRAGYSPEFRMRMPRQALERAENRLNEIRYQMAQGTLSERNDILERARRVLREEGCERILRADLEIASGSAAASLVTSKTEPLGRAARWMHAHIYYGFAAGVLALAHGGAHFQSPMGWALNGLTILVVGSGLIGLVFWTLGPEWMTRLERDLSIEEAFVLDRHFDRRLTEALLPVEEMDRATARSIARLSPDSTQAWSDARTKLAGLLDGSDGDARARDILALAGQRQHVKGELTRLMRVRFAMNAWRLVHIPASIALLFVIAAHVLSVWLY
jgi:hypothetical protein